MKKSFGRSNLRVALLTSLLSVAFGAALLADSTATVKRTSNLRADHDVSSTLLKSLPRSTRLAVLDPAPQNGYLHVRTTEGEEGWVFARNVTVVKGPAVAAGGPGVFSDHCPGGSALPFAALELHHAIDDRCGISGKSTSPANSRLQNAVKNNFCATANGAPETFTPQMLVDLQHHTHVPTGQGHEPSSRTAQQPR